LWRSFAKGQVKEKTALQLYFIIMRKLFNGYRHVQKFKRTGAVKGHFPVAVMIYFTFPSALQYDFPVIEGCPYTASLPPLNIHIYLHLRSASLDESSDCIFISTYSGEVCFCFIVVQQGEKCIDPEGLFSCWLT
jgi:hypothetical protein